MKENCTGMSVFPNRYAAVLRRLASLALVLTAMGSASAQGAAPAIEIPVVLPLTGSSAFDGQAARIVFQSIEASTNDGGGINGRPLKFVYYDDQSSPQVAVQATELALAAKPPALLGSFVSAQCQAMVPLTQGKTVQYCLSPGIHPPYGTDVFSSSVGSDGQALAMLRYISARGWKRVALIASTEASGQDGEAQVRAMAALPERASAGLSIVDAEHFAPSDQSVSAQLQRIRATNPDVLLVWASAGRFGTVARGYTDAGLTIPTFFSNAALSKLLMKQFAEFLPRELYFAGPVFLAGPAAPGLPPGVRDAMRRLYAAAAAAGFAVDMQSGNAWDPPQIIVDALRHAGPNPKAVHDWILAQRHWSGTSGVYDFSDGPGAQRGLTVKDTIIYRWDPAPQSFTPVSGLGG